MSCRTTTAPCAPSAAAGAARAMIVRHGSRGGESCSASGEPPPEILNGVVERPCNRAELIVAIVDARGRQIARTIAARHVGDTPDAQTDPAGDNPGYPGGGQVRPGERGQGRV